MNRSLCLILVSLVILAAGCNRLAVRPDRLDFGEMRADEKRHAVVRFTAPATGLVEARFADQRLRPGEFFARWSVAHITRYRVAGIGPGGAELLRVIETTTLPRLAVREGERIAIGVSFHPGRDDNGVMSTSLTISIDSWGGANVPSRGVVTLLGDRGAVVASVEPTTLKVPAGDSMLLRMTLVNIGAARVVDIALASGPAGFGVVSARVSMKAGETQIVSLHAFAQADAPNIAGAHAELSLSYSGVTRVAPLNVSIGCGTPGLPPCPDTECQGKAHPSWDDDARELVCNEHCGNVHQPACRTRYRRGDGTLGSRFRCYGHTQLSGQFAGGDCVCAAGGEADVDTSDDSGLCISGSPSGDRPDPPDCENQDCTQPPDPPPPPQP